MKKERVERYAFPDFDVVLLKIMLKYKHMIRRQFRRSEKEPFLFGIQKDTYADIAQQNEACDKDKYHMRMSSALFMNGYLVRINP